MDPERTLQTTPLVCLGGDSRAAASFNPHALLRHSPVRLINGRVLGSTVRPRGRQESVDDLNRKGCSHAS